MAYSNSMVNIGEIEPVATLAEIHQQGNVYQILRLARKFLPFENCAVRDGYHFHFEAIFAVYIAFKKYGLAVDLGRICQACFFRFECPMSREVNASQKPLST